MSHNKKSALGGAPVVPEVKEDLLAKVFGDKTKADTPPRPSGTKPDRVAKYFQIDRQLAKELKLFAIENGMKDFEVIEKALINLFGKR